MYSEFNAHKTVLVKFLFSPLFWQLDTRLSGSGNLSWEKALTPSEWSTGKCVGALSLLKRLVRVQHTERGTSPGQAILGVIKRGTDHESVSYVLSWFLLQLLPPASRPDFPSQWIVMWMHTPNKPSPSQVWRGSHIAFNRKQTKREQNFPKPKKQRTSHESSTSSSAVSALRTRAGLVLVLPAKLSRSLVSLPVQHSTQFLPAYSQYFLSPGPWLFL